MNRRLELLYGSLLHDIGKIIYRGNKTEFARGTHSKLGYEYIKKFDELDRKGVLDSIRYHHYHELYNSKLSNDSLAYITYIADNIASGFDRREKYEEGDVLPLSKSKFDMSTPLSSIFNILNKDKNNKISTGSFQFSLDEKTKYPSKKVNRYTKGNYDELKIKMNEHLSGPMKFSDSHFSSLLQWTETLWSNIPSSTNQDELVDISLYDHSKMTCAIANNIFVYLDSKGVSDYKNTLFTPFKNTKSFYKEEAFLILSMDMSGIQSFIYNISGTNALKNLRARSFYLELMIEVIVDDLIEKLNLTRANLLYTGGGHTYLILPNTNKVKEIIEEFQQQIKEWFIKEFKTDLSLVISYQECSSNDLMNLDGNYKNIWKKLSVKLSEAKSNKYNATDILFLNNTEVHGERECRECQRSDIHINESDLCTICDNIIKISNDLRDKEFFVLTSDSNTKKYLKMPFYKNIIAVDREYIESDLKGTTVRIYSKNKSFIGNDVSTNLWMADYDAASEKIETRFEGIASYAKRKIGIERLGVLRADIDNLGTAFIRGIPESYQSLSRTATLSRNLSMFFKYELNDILQGSNISIIYSGGDDVFLIGAWDDIIEKSIVIRNKFKLFTLNTLTLSAGIGIFKPKFPVSQMAYQTGVLEEESKTGNKDQVTLWQKDKLYSWEQLEKNILKEKVGLLEKAIKSQSDIGNSVLYSILSYLRNKDDINIARLAYLLARSNIDNKYTGDIFKWANDEHDCKELITAIEYYIYKNRK